MIIFISDQEQRLLWKDNMGRKSNFVGVRLLHCVFVLRLQAWFPSSSLHVLTYCETRFQPMHSTTVSIAACNNVFIACMCHSGELDGGSDLLLHITKKNQAQ